MNKCRRIFVFPVVCILASVVLGQDERHSPGKQDVAVIGLGVLADDIPINEAATLTETFVSTIFKTQDFDLVERSQLEKVIQEQDFQLTDFISNDKALKVGKLIKADFIIIGTIGKSGSNYVLNVRMVDVASGKIYRAEKEPTTHRNELLRLVEKVGRRMAGLEKSRKWWYISGGTVVLAGAAAYFLLKPSPAPTVPDLPGSPPGHP